MDRVQLDQEELDVLRKLLARVTAHRLPDGIDFHSFLNAWPNEKGRDYFDAHYRPHPIDAYLSDDLVLRKPWFLVMVAQTVDAPTAHQLIERAGQTGLLDEFDIRHEGPDMLLARRQPTRLAQLAHGWIEPLRHQPLCVSASLLIAAHHGGPVPEMDPAWAPAAEVELALAAHSAGIGWQPAQYGTILFGTASVGETAKPKSDKKLAEAKARIATLEAELARLQSMLDDEDESGSAKSFKKIYRRHIQAYHPDKLAGKSEIERKVGEEVSRVLNALYQELKG